MKTKAVLLVATLTTILANFAQADNQRWHNIPGLNSGDVEIFVDYKTNTTVPSGAYQWHGTPQGPDSFQIDATPIWINVKRANLQSNDRVQVMVINYSVTRYRGEWSDKRQDTIHTADLNFAESGRFTGSIEPFTMAYQLNDGYALTQHKYWQEIVVWINGRIYKDNNTGNNLAFDMSYALRY